MTTRPLHMHATAVAICGKGVLLRGPSGSGKSDLALRLAEHEDCQLIADDQVMFEPEKDQLIMRPAPILAGKLEVRGIGIVSHENIGQCALHLVVDLTTEITRMPEKQQMQTSIMGRNFSRIFLDPFEVSAAAKLRIAVQHLK